jgi:hypothetical protein
MKRTASIEALLRKSRAGLVDVKSGYDLSLNQKHISEDLKVDIKNVFENLRSCLDYLAKDIFETHCLASKPSNKLYFPIRSTPKEFNQALQKDYPNLQVSSQAIVNVLENVQPYRDPWLGQFNQLNNNNKHQDLVEQTRTESRRVTVSREDGAVSWGPEVTFGGGVSVMGVPIDPSTQMPVPNNVAHTEVTTWVDFHLKDNGQSVLPFIETSLLKVEKIFRDLAPHI